MNFSTRLTEKLPGFFPAQSSPLVLRKGVSEVRFFSVANHSRRLRWELQKTMAWSLERAETCDCIDMISLCESVVFQTGVSSILEKSLNPGIDTIGIRVPDCEFIREVSRGSRNVLALTSANLSGHRSSVCVKDFENLWPQCAYVYDGGLLPSGRGGSTIVDLTKVGKYKIIRSGSAEPATVAILDKYLLEEEES